MPVPKVERYGEYTNGYTALDTTCSVRFRIKPEWRCHWGLSGWFVSSRENCSRFEGQVHTVRGVPLAVITNDRRKSLVKIGSGGRGT